MGEGRLKACPYDKKVTRKIEKNLSMRRGLFEKSTWFTGGGAKMLKNPSAWFMYDPLYGFEGKILKYIFSSFSKSNEIL